MNAKTKAKGRDLLFKIKVEMRKGESNELKQLVRKMEDHLVYIDLTCSHLVDESPTKRELLEEAEMLWNEVTHAAWKNGIDLTDLMINY